MESMTFNEMIKDAIHRGNFNEVKRIKKIMLFRNGCEIGCLKKEIKSE